MYATENGARKTGHSGATGHGVCFPPNILDTTRLKQKQGYLFHIKIPVTTFLHKYVTQ